MKKIISMLLVLTIVASTLMGTMVMEANAATDDKVTNYEITDNGSKITLRFGSMKLPTSGLNAMNGFVLGDWYANGYTYSEEDIDAFYDGTATTIYGTPTPTVNFLSANVFEHPLADNIVKYDFKPVTIEDGINVAKNYVAKNYAESEKKPWFGATGLITTDKNHNANYSRVSAFPKIDTAIDKQKAIDDNTYSFSQITQNGAIATNTNSTAYVLSFYAYTQNVGSGVGQTIFFDTRSGTGSTGGIYLYSDDLVSTEGIPHKVDIVLSSDGTNLYEHYYVDGVEIREGSSQTIPGAVSFQPRFNINAFVNSSSADSEPISDTDWYMPYYTTTTQFKLVSQADLNNELIIVPNYKTKDKSATVRTDDYITGVIDSLDADIKAALETTTPGDKIVEISETNYNDPASLFTGDASTVKLVSKTTGKEVAVADATGTMDNYLFMVNGVYVVPEKVADPLPYYKSSTVPFEVTEDKHQTTQTRVHFENYKDNVMDEDLPALGGLRSGFLKYTSDPRGTFSFFNGTIKYNTNDGYYGINAPQVKLIDAEGYDKKLTLQFDIYMPEYVATSSNNARFVLGGHTNPTEERTNASGYGQEFGEYIYITTNGLKDSNFTGKRVMNIKGNAWNTITMVLDSTDTATDGKYDISLYVNGERQQSYETGADYIENAKERLCSLHLSRLYMPLYTSVAVMNYAWYVGDYTQYTTPVANDVIDSKRVTGAEIFVDETNGLISYNNAEDTDYSTLVAAMTAAGYQPVYNQVINTDLINEKYDEVDGTLTNVVNEDGTRTVTGKLVKKWMDSPSTNVDVVATIDKNGFSTYAIKDNNITKAVDNGNGTASITIKSSFGNTTSIKGVASTYEDIIAALAAEEPACEGRSLELVGFAVIETDKLPKVYTLVPSGLEIRNLTFNKSTNEAELSYRKFGNVANAVSFQLVVAAYDKDGKLLELKSDVSKTINNSTKDGESIITFKPEFSKATLSKTKHYKVFMFDSLVYCNPLFKSAKIDK